MKIFLIIIFLFISSLGFSQIKKLNDSTYTLSKNDMDKLYELMIDYETLDTLAKRYLVEIQELKNIIKLKDNIIEKKDTIISIKDSELDSAQKILTSFISTKEKIWQGLNLGVKVESPEDVQLKDVDYRNLRYSLEVDVGIRLGDFTFNPGMDLYLSGQKPKYFINFKYKIF